MLVSVSGAQQGLARMEGGAGESCGPARLGMNLGPSEARSGGDSFVVFFFFLS